MGKFQFGNVVVLDGSNIGVIVKSWDDGDHDVYVRTYSGVITYHEKNIQHFVYSKDLSEEEMKFY